METKHARNNIYIKDLREASIQHSLDTPQWVELRKLNEDCSKDNKQEK